MSRPAQSRGGTSEHPDLKRISTAIAYELQLLIDRLLTLGAVDPDAYREDEIDWMHWIGADTGEIVVALIVRERTYWEDSRSKDIIVQREAKGRMEWTRLDKDGEEIEPWDWARPPSRSVGN